MTPKSKMNASLRDTILAKPETLLDDPEVMRALVGANERANGANVVDLRGVAMRRLESRLDRLEETHRSVIAAAYDNLAGTNLVHRAILRMLDPLEFPDFLHNLGGEVSDILRVDTVVLFLESQQSHEAANISQFDGVLRMAAPGFVNDYAGAGQGPLRQVTLRQLADPDPMVHGPKADWIRSEACMTLNLGPGRLPGMLVLGAEDPHQFTPKHGTDLLSFFAGVFERSMRHWLS